MNSDLWLQRWDSGQIGFHRAEPNATLVANEAWLLAAGPHRVFVPLCGKSVDLPWLRVRGHRVVGAELAERAVRALFEEHGLAPEVTEVPPFRRFEVDGLTVWCGDVFALDAARVGPVDRVWDRAALIALPPEVRPRYVDHLRRLAPGATMLLETLSYSAGGITGPPFSVSPEEVRRLYPGAELLDDRDVFPNEARWAGAGHTWARGASWKIGGG